MVQAKGMACPFMEQQVLGIAAGFMFNRGAAEPANPDRTTTLMGQKSGSAATVCIIIPELEIGGSINFICILDQGSDRKYQPQDHRQCGQWPSAPR